MNSWLYMEKGRGRLCFAGMITLRTWRWGGYLGLSVWVHLRGGAIRVRVREGDGRIDADVEIMI